MHFIHIFFIYSFVLAYIFIHLPFSGAHQLREDACMSDSCIQYI